MRNMLLPRLVWLLIFHLAFVKGKGIDTSYQCHDLYEYDACRKGVVTSPFYNERDRYHDELWCEYRITAPPGNRIKLTFLDMDIDPSSGCSQDRLFVYSQNKESVIGSFCGSELPRPLLSLEGQNEVNLLFQTDYMGSAKGFKLQYESAPDMKLCQSGFSECRNRNCYDAAKKCDGVDDCADGTDEEDCGYPLVAQPELCGSPAITPDTVYGSPDRIVGGVTAIPNSWPWQVSLRTKSSEPNGHFCGGTLLNSQWVLTASHCAAAVPYPESMAVHIGAHYEFKKTKYEQTRTASKIIAYPDLELEQIRRYDITDDIALVKLNAPVKFNDGVNPACLPEFGWELKPGWSCYVTGWGETRGTGGSDQLKQSIQTIEPQEKCSYNKRTQICVGKQQNSPCHGDSGGPLHCKLGGRWYLFGAASFVTTSNLMGGLCTGPGARTVYANVADKMDWIRAVINKYT